MRFPAARIQGKSRTMILATAFILSQLPALYASELHIKLPLPGTAINPGGETALGELALSSRPISLRVFPNLSCIIAPGDKIQLQVKALLENGGEIDVTNNRHTAYSSSDTVVVSVSSGGLVSALSSGQALIRVEYLNAVAYAEARANPQASVLGLNALFGVEDSSEMFPEETAPSASGTLAPGDRAQLSVMALLSDGETCHLTGNTGTTYVSGNTQVANIDASGQISAIGMGETQISVQAVGISTAAIAYVRLRDETAPVTSVFFSTPSHISPSGGVYISPYSLVHLDAADPVVESAFSSGVGFTGISIDEIPSAFADLWRYEPFSVIEGTYTFYFASRDHASNTEVTRSTSVTVDGTAPGPALDVKVDGESTGIWKNVREFLLSWTDPEDVSGIAGARVKFGGAAPASNDEGVFYPAAGSLVFASTEIVNGSNVVWLWLEDNVGNADPLTAVNAICKYDTAPPDSSAWTLDPVSFSPMQVTFNSIDSGAGVESTTLWWRRDEAGNGYFGDWQATGMSIPGETGSFWFDPQEVEGNYAFYTQSIDRLGNSEPLPVSSTVAKARTLFDKSPPLPVFIGDGDFTNNPEMLSAYWDIYDPVSGLNDIQIGVGTGPGMDDVKTFESIGVKSSATITISPPLADGEYFVSVKARNRAWLWSEAAAGDGIIVDTIPPTPPEIEKPFNGEYITASVITGKAEPNSTIIISGPDGILGSGITGPDGRFSAGFSGMPLGRGQVSVAARDMAGNISSPVNLDIVLGATSFNPRTGDFGIDVSTVDLKHSAMNYGKRYASTLDHKVYHARTIPYYNAVELQSYDPFLQTVSEPVFYNAFPLGIFSADSKIYLAGADSLFMIDPMSGGMSPAARMPTTRYDFAIASYGGRVYVIGGGTYEQYFSALEAYDPEIDSWKALAPMPTRRHSLTAVHHTGKIYAFGGMSAQGTSNTVEEYNPKTNTWNSRPPSKIPRYGHHAAVIGGTVLLYGGSSESLEIYDPVSGDSRIIGTLPQELLDSPGAVINDSLVIIGKDLVATVQFKDITVPPPPNPDRITIVPATDGNGYEVRGLSGSIHNLKWKLSVAGYEETSYTGEIQQIQNSNTFVAPADISGIVEVNTQQNQLYSKMYFQPKPLSVYNVDVFLRGHTSIFPTLGTFRLYEDGVIIQTESVGYPMTGRTATRDPSSIWVYNTLGTTTRLDPRRDSLEGGIYGITGEQTLQTGWQTDLARNNGVLSGVAATVDYDNPRATMTITGVAGMSSGVLIAEFPAAELPATEPLSKVRLYSDVFAKNLIGEVIADKTGAFGRIGVPEFTPRLFIVAEDEAGNTSPPTELLVYDTGGPIITGATVDHSTFSPNSDGRYDTVNINYRISAAAYITISILDSSSAAVRALVSDQYSSSGTATFVWDGCGDDGPVLPQGLYSVKIEAIDSNGVAAIPMYSIVYIDLTSPDPPMLIEPADNVVLSTSTPFLAGIAEPGTLIEIYRGVDLLTSTLTAINGEFFARIQAPLPDGAYPLSVHATDAAGNRSKGAVLLLNIDTGASHVEVPIDTHYLPLAYGGAYNIALDTTTRKALLSSYGLHETVTLLNLEAKSGEKNLWVGGARASIAVNPALSQAVVAAPTQIFREGTGWVYFSRLSIIDLKTGLLSEIPGEFPVWRFLGVTDSIIAAGRPNDGTSPTTIAAVDPVTFSSRTIAEIPDTITGMAVHSLLKLAVISSAWGIKTIDLSNGEVLAHTTLTKCTGIAVDSQSGRGLAACDGSTYILDVSKTGITVTSMMPGISGDLLAIEPMGRRAVVSSRGSGSLRIFDPANTDDMPARVIHLTFPCYGISIDSVDSTVLTAESTSDEAGYFSIIPLPDVARPIISDVTSNSDFFSPALGTFEIGFELSESANITVDVLRASPPNDTVKRILENAPRPTGPNIVRWNGKDDHYEQLPEGDYLVRITAMDLSGNVSSPALKRVSLDFHPPQVSVISARPDAFSPFFGGEARFLISLSEKAELLLKVVDSAGSEVKTLITGSSYPPGTLNFSWDGRDNDGLIVPPGIYSMQAVATDAAGNTAMAMGSSCEILGPEAPAITQFIGAPNPFFPEDLSADKNSIRFSYFLHGNSTAISTFPVTLDIVHPQYGVIKTSSVDQSTGFNEIVWDGFSDSAGPLEGQLIPDGVYTANIQLKIAGEIASTNSVFVALRANQFSAYSEESEQRITIHYDNPDATISILAEPPIPTQASLALQSQTAAGNFIASPIYDIVADKSFATAPILRVKYDPIYAGDSLLLMKYDGSTKNWIPASTVFFADIASNEMIFTLKGDVLLGSLFALFRISDPISPVVTLPHAFPQVFSPDGDGIADTATITYHLFDNSSSPLATTITIHDAEQAIRRHLLNSTIRPLGDNSESWDGRDDHNEILPNGDYFFAIQVVDSAGNSAPRVQGEITLRRDDVSPGTSLSIIGSTWTGIDSAYKYANHLSSVALIAVDPAVFQTTSTGVSFTEYRVNPASPTAIFHLYSKPFELSREGLWVVEFRSQDNAGNLEETRTAFIYVDGTPPLTEALLSGTTGQNDWHTSPVAVTLISTDALSGLATVHYSLDGGEASVYISSFAVAAEGEHSLAFHAMDNVGNVEPERTASFRIDVTTPEVIAVSSPVPNAAGWNNTPVAVVFSGTDTASGIAYCTSSFTVTTEGRNIPVSGYCADYAGWTSTAALALSIDMTPPGIAIPSPAAGQVFIATRGKIDIGFAVSDNLDPAPVFGAFLVQTEDRGSPRGERPADIAVSSGQAIEPLDIDDGLWRLTVSATDFADNAAYLQGGVFEVIHDVLPPVSALLVTGSPRFEAEGLTYVTDASSITLTSLDDLVEPLDGIGLGVRGQTLLMKSGAATVKELAFINPSPAQSEVLVSTLAFTGWSLPDGLYHLDYFATDVLDNIEAVRRSTITLDNTPPQASAGLAGTAGENGWHISTVTVSLTAVDALSGVAGTFYRLDGKPEGAFAEYAAAFDVAGEGEHSLLFYAADNLGNAGVPSERAFRLDLTPPMASARVNPAANEAGWHNTAVSVVFSGTDAVSGISYCAPEKTAFAEGRDMEVSGYCRDFAGLSSTATARLNIDLTSPTITADRLPAVNEYGWNNTDVTATFDCLDVLSGIKSCPDGTVFSNEGAGQGTGGTAYDHAGNSSSAAVSGINIDKAAPESSLSVSGDMRQDAEKRYISLRTGITLAASDPVSGGTASGVESVEYRIDAEPFLVYTSSFSLAEGVRTVAHRAHDKAGNAEALKSAVFHVDATPPVTAFSVGGARHDADGLIYITKDSALLLAAADPVSKEVASGVLLTRYRVDGGAWMIYAGSFTITPEGRHTLEYLSLDRVNNTEAVKTAELVVDNTPPEASAGLAGTSGENGWHISTVTVSLSAEDALSGVAGIFYRLDGKPEGAFAEYVAAFDVAGEGEHSLLFYAADNLGNTAAPAERPFGIDLTPPLVSESVSPTANGAGWHNTAAGVVFSGTDAVSGISYCEPEKTASSEGRDIAVSGYCRDFAGLSSTATARLNIDLTSPTVRIERAPSANAHGWNNSDVTASFICGDALSGVKTCPPDVVFASEGADQGTSGAAFDYADNRSSAAISGINIDKTPPVSAVSASGDVWSAAGNTYLSLRSVITLSAVDPVSGGTASGIEGVDYYVDSGAFDIYSSAFGLSEGVRTVHYRARDNAGNIETARAAEFLVDNTAPVSRWLVSSGANIELDGKFYLNAAGKIALESADPVVNGVASGVEGVYYGVGAAPGLRYAVPFGLAEGIRTIGFTAKDNVLNIEVLKSTVIYADGTAPVSELSVSGDQYRGIGLYVSPRSLVMIAAADPVIGGVASGVRDTLYAVDGGTFSAYSPFSLAAEGRRTVSFYSSDRVDNVEAAKTAGLLVDATPPVTAFSVAGARHDADGVVYITKDSALLLSADDPVSNEVASGVLLTRYRMDGGAWTVYTGSFTITAEGRHTLEYLSLDRVNNAEAVRTVELALDNTPPASSISLGEPKFTAFGLSVLTPATPVTLSAYDPLVGEVASGLRGISYELVPYGASSGERRDYLEPFTLPQGAWEVRFWSDDNVGNTEPVKSAVLAVSTLQRDALASVAGLDAAGSSDIAGAVRSNAAVSVAGNARILGDVTAAAIALTGKKAQITGVRTEASGTLSPEPIPLTLIENFVAAAGSEVNSGVPERYLVDGKLVVSEQAELILTTGTYRFAGIELAGGCEVKAGGPVNILVEGDILISGGSGLNAEGPASLMNLFLNKTSSVTFTGGGKVAAYLYAPYAHMGLTGNSLLGGHYFVGASSVSGNGNLVQSGEALPEPAPAAGDKFKTSGFTTADASYGVLAGPDAAFRLGEVYVFPNPALRGAAPTFHFECGVADSVNIKIYTTSGRFAHETTLTGMPVALDDGNGLSYAYEYAWRDHIPSGVYYYLIEAAKSGQKLKKTGKFAVVR